MFTKEFSQTDSVVLGDRRDHVVVAREKRGAEFMACKAAARDRSCVVAPLEAVIAPLALGSGAGVLGVSGVFDTIMARASVRDDA